MKLESTHAGHSVGWPALVALILVPLLAVASFITLGSNNNDDRVSAAVVNLDEAVELDGQTVPLGRQLAAAILERDGENIGWTLADAKNAKDGLDSGKFSAVVTIPKEFSAAATSFSDNDADTARQATVSVTTSDNAPVTDAAVAQEIARLAADTINAQLTESYLDNIYVGFNQVGEQFTTIVDGATQLSDGAGELADGTGQASEGAVQLSDGLQTLSENSQELVGGGEQLADGVSQLSDGVRQLVPGASALASGASDLATGVAGLADGASGLADGASQLSTGVSGLETGASALADGASQLNAGVAELNTQAPALAKGVDDLATGAKPLLGEMGVPRFAAGAKEALQGVPEIKGGIDQILDQLTGTPDPGAKPSGPAADFAPLITGSRGLADGITQVDNTLKAFASGDAAPPAEALAGAGQVKGAYTCPAEVDAPTCDLLTQTFEAGVDGGFTAGFRAGTGTGSAALNAPDATSSVRGGAVSLADNIELLPGQIQSATEEQLGDLIAGLQRISDGAGELITQSQPLVDSADELGGGSTQLLGGINELNSQIAALPAGISQLADGSSQLASGSSELSSGVTQLSTGASGLASGASQLSSGVNQLSDGANQLSAGASQLSDGVGQLGGATSQLSTGISTFVDGVRQYTGGVDSAAVGASQFSDAIVQLDDGTEQLAEGLDTFATELEKGTEEVPSYSQEAREKLSTVVTNPVAQSDDLVDNSRAALVALVVVAMLWIASLATFVVARAIPSNVLTSSSSTATLWIRTLGVPMLITAGEGLVFGLMGGVVLELSAGRMLGLMAFLAVLAAVFVLVNHALTAWLGNVGRGISLLLLAMTVALGLTSAAPGVFNTVAAISPVQTGLLMIRTWISDGTGMAGFIGALLLVAVVALLASVFAIASRRKLSAAQFRGQVASQS